MKVLELFSGSKSITKFFENLPNVEVISLDFEKKYNPDICCDIMEFDYKQYDVGHFDIIWSSPECKIFSQLQNTMIGRVGGRSKKLDPSKTMEKLNEKRKENSKYILKTIEIIKYLNPKYYFIENPQYSTIWNYIPQEFNIGVNVSYCMFGYDYKKNTRILTNKVLEDCLCKKKNKLNLCNNKNIHNATIGKFGSQKQTLLERYSIPQDLLKYLFFN